MCFHVNEQGIFYIGYFTYYPESSRCCFLFSCRREDSRITCTLQVHTAGGPLHAYALTPLPPPPRAPRPWPPPLRFFGHSPLQYLVLVWYLTKQSPFTVHRATLQCEHPYIVSPRPPSSFTQTLQRRCFLMSNSSSCLCSILLPPTTVPVGTSLSGWSSTRREPRGGGEARGTSDGSTSDACRDVVRTRGLGAAVRVGARRGRLI